MIDTYLRSLIAMGITSIEVNMQDGEEFSIVSTDHLGDSMVVTDTSLERCLSELLLRQRVKRF